MSWSWGGFYAGLFGQIAALFLMGSADYFTGRGFVAGLALGLLSRLSVLVAKDGRE